MKRSERQSLSVSESLGVKFTLAVVWLMNSCVFGLFGAETPESA